MNLLLRRRSEAFHPTPWGRTGPFKYTRSTRECSMVQSECNGMDRMLDAAQMLLRRPLDVVQTARCCSDRVFYNILFTFPGLGGTPGDRSMLFRPCILQYIIHFPGSRRNSRRPLDVVQTVYYTIYYSLSRVSEDLPETARCCSDRAFYNILFTFPGLGGAAETGRHDY